MSYYLILAIADPALVLGMSVYDPDDVLIGDLALPCALLARLLGLMS